MNTPTVYVVAMGNAFFLKGGTLFAAPMNVYTGEPDWTFCYEVERDDDDDPRAVDSIVMALHTLTA